MAADGAVTELDWAAFTSTTSIMGQGYRVVAATPGLTAEEKKAIATMSPSHNAMCSPSDDARGLAFYSLGTGRTCVAYTQHAGNEQTGRGGKRVLTLAFALSADQMADFAWNPLAVLDALKQTDLLDPVVPKDGALERVRVRTCATVTRRSIENARDKLGRHAALCALSYAMSDGCLILGDVADAPEVLEAVLLATPSSMRAQCTLSIGLKFTLSRRLRIHVIEADNGATERIIRGQAVRYIADSASYDPSTDGESPWVCMVTDCRATGHVAELSALTAQPFDDTTPETLERLADRQTAINHISTAGIDDVLAVLLTDHSEDTPPRIEQWLMERHAVAATRRLVALMSIAKADDVRNHWPALLAIGQSNAEVARVCDTLAERVGGLDSRPWADTASTVTAS